MSPLPLLSPPAGRGRSAYDLQRTGSRAALAESRRPIARPSPPRAEGTGAQAALPRTRRPRQPMEMSDYQLAGCPLVIRTTRGTQAVRRAMTGGNLLSACPRAEFGGPAGRTAGLCNPPVDRSPDSRINAERQGLPMPTRPCGRGSLAGAKLRRPIRRAEHSDRRPSAPACRPLPAYSGGTVWDSHPLPGIVGSRAVGGSIAPLRPLRRTPDPAARRDAPAHARVRRSLPHAPSSTPPPSSPVRRGPLSRAVRHAPSSTPLPPFPVRRGALPRAVG